MSHRRSGSVVSEAGLSAITPAAPAERATAAEHVRTKLRCTPALAAAIVDRIGSSRPVTTVPYISTDVLQHIAAAILDQPAEPSQEAP